MDANDQTARSAVAANEVGEAGSRRRPDPRARKRTAQLESQEDLAYIAGQHDAKEAEKQVRTTGSRRQSAKGKDSARDEQR